MALNRSRRVGLALAVATAVVAGAAALAWSSLSSTGQQAHPPTQEEIDTIRQTRLAVGVFVALEDERLPVGAETTLPDGRPRQGHVELRTRPNMDAQDGGLATGSSGEVKFKVNVRLDLTVDPVKSGTDTITLAAGDPASARVPFQLPELAAGRHCLSIAAVADSPTTIAAQRPSLSNSSNAVIQVGSSTTNHCQGGPPRLPLKPVPAEADVVLPCGFPPIISTNPARPSLQRRVPFGTPLYGYLPDCGGKGSVLFVRDDAFYDKDDRLKPFSIPPKSDGPSNLVVELPQLPAGTWRMFVVVEGADTPTAYLSEPVQIGGQ